MVQFILKWPLTYIKRLSKMLRSRSFIYFINMLSFCDNQVFERKFLSFVSVIVHGNLSNPHGDAKWFCFVLFREEELLMEER